MRSNGELRWIPKNALPVAETGLGVVYVYPYAPIDAKYWDGKPRYGVVAYREKARKSDWHHTYRSDAEVDKAIQGFFDAIRAHKAIVSERRDRDFAGHSFKVGDIVTNSWGYDQTNVDWYVVTRTTANYVWLKGVAAELTTSEGCGPMSGNVALKLDENLKPIESSKPETKHRASGDYVTMRHGCGSKHTGGSLYTSWYA
jgi:hypothetical protein